jgi:hypothetical protein
MSAFGRKYVSSVSVSSQGSVIGNGKYLPTSGHLVATNITQPHFPARANQQNSGYAWAGENLKF